MTDLAPGSRMQEWLEQAWLDRYLAGQLGQAENDWFEAYMLDNADLLQQVEADANLREAFAHARPAVAASGQTPPAGTATTVEPRSQPHAANRSESDRHDAAAPSSPRARAPWLASIATAAIALLLGWFGHSRLSVDAGGGQLVTNPTRLSFLSTRGREAARHVENAGSKAAMVVVEVAVPIGASQVRLRVGSRAPVPLEVAADGTVSFLLARKAVTSGDDVGVQYAIGGAVQELVLPMDGVVPEG
jgi:hypothetical protein